VKRNKRHAAHESAGGRARGAGGRSVGQLRHLVQPDLGQVQIAAGVAPDAMGAHGDRPAPRQQPAVRRVHAEARDLVGDVDRARPVDVDVHRMVQVAPLLVEVPPGAEQLHPVVLAIGDEHAVVRVGPDALAGHA
jgi:hypothetical protein